MTSIVKLTSSRETGNRKTEETRWLISSLIADANTMSNYIRKPWEVENSPHWVLDVIFREDMQRKRNANAAQNYSLFRK